jgi:Putative phage tail protein
MPYVDPACKVAGVGPSCDVGERGERDKENCISRVKARTIGEFANCLATCVESSSPVRYADRIALIKFGERKHNAPHLIPVLKALEQKKLDEIRVEEQMLFDYLVSSGQFGHFQPRFVARDDPTNDIKSARITAAKIMQSYDPDFYSPYLDVDSIQNGVIPYSDLGLPQGPPLRKTAKSRREIIANTYTNLSYDCNASCKGRCFQALTGAEALKQCHCTRLTCISCLPAQTSHNLVNEQKRVKDIVERDRGKSSVTVPSMPKLTVTGSEYGGVIDEVTGRGLVTGNIIWIGNKRAFDVNVKTLDRATVLERREYVTFVDFAVALARGPIEGLARLFFGDRLVLNNSVAAGGSSLIVDNELEGVDVDAPDLFAQYPLTVDFMSGGADQRVHGSMTGGVGYRDLSYALVRNFPLKVVDASIPLIRAELYSSAMNADETTITQTAATASNPSAVFRYGAGVLHDRGTRSIVLAPDYGIAEFTPPPDVTLSIEHMAEFDPTSLYVADNGTYVYQSASAVTRRTTYFVDPNATHTLTSYGTDAPDDTPPSATGLRRYSSAHVAVGTAILSGRVQDVYAFGQGRYLSFVYWDAGNRVVQHVASHDLGIGASIQAVKSVRFRFGSVQRTTISVFWTAPDNTGVVLSAYPLYDTTRGSTETFSAAPINTATTLTNKLWGSIGNKVHEVYPDERDATFLIVMDVSGTGRAFKLRAIDLTTIFDNIQTALPPPLTLNIPARGDIVWADAVGIHTLSRVTGTTSSRATTFTVPPAMGGRQRYDAGENRVMYIDTTGALHHRLLNRLSPVSIPVKKVIEYYLDRALPSPDLYDIDISESLLLRGYVITDDSTVADILEGLIKVFNLRIYESDGKVVVREAASSPRINISADDRLMNGSTVIDEERWDVSSADVTSYSLTYLSSEQHLASRVQTAQSDVYRNAVEDFVDAGRKNTISIPIVLTSLEAAAVAERLLRVDWKAGHVRKVGLGPKHWRIDAGDEIAVGA